MADGTGGLGPVQALALVGVVGLGAQWLGWRFRLPSIVLMLALGILVGPVTGWFIPARDIGPIYQPLVSVAVAVVLFEGGLTLDYRRLGDSRSVIRRLVFIGAPLGWLLSTLVLHVLAGLSWQASMVFGGVMVVTGPTVIAPMLRQARLPSHPARILQWEAIVNDPIGVLIAVLALEVAVVLNTEVSVETAVWVLVRGIGLAAAAGLLAGKAVTVAFDRGWVPEYMKGPALFVAVVAVFAATDSVLHESGLLAVTLMGIVIANADLSSFNDLRRFKEQATILLVSGVFILLAASLDFSTLAALDWRSAVFVLGAILLVRPLQVLLPLIGSALPMRERLLVATTGPRGVVMVAVSGLFGQQLVDAGVPDGALLAPLSFILVLITVIVHGFTLGPIARKLGLSAGEGPGLMIVGASPFATQLALAMEKAGAEVLIADPSRERLHEARHAHLKTFYGDILGQAAEHHVEFITYSSILVASDNDAYNTLVATDMGPEYGREMIWQLARAKDASRHALPATLGGRSLAGSPSLDMLNRRLAEGWEIRTTRLTEEYDIAAWRADRPGAEVIARVGERIGIDFIEPDEEVAGEAGIWLISMVPPGTPSRRRPPRAGRTAGEADETDETDDGGAAVVEPV